MSPSIHSAFFVRFAFPLYQRQKVQCQNTSLLHVFLLLMCSFCATEDARRGTSPKNWGLPIVSTLMDETTRRCGDKFVETLLVSPILTMGSLSKSHQSWRLGSCKFYLPREVLQVLQIRYNSCQDSSIQGVQKPKAGGHSNGHGGLVQPVMSDNACNTVIC